MCILKFNLILEMNFPNSKNLIALIQIPIFHFNFQHKDKEVNA